MSKLPTSKPSWKEMRLDEIGDLVSGGTPSTSNPDYWDGSIAWATPADLSVLRTRHLKTTERTLTNRGLANGAARMLPARSLVVSSRAPIGHMALPLVDFCTNQGCKSIKFHEGHDPDFHFYNLRFHVRRLHDKGEGTTFAEISKTAMESVTVPVPTDEHVQTTIARVLVKLDNAIEQTEALLAKQQRIKTGLMHDLLTCGLDAQGRLRDPSTHRFKKSLFGMIPEEWRPSKAGAECDQICVGIVIRPSQYYSETGVVALRSMNVLPGFFDLSEVVRISHEANNSLTKSRLKAGDVVTVRTGEPGTTAVVTPDLEGCNCIDLVISRPSKTLRSQFLAIWMNSAFAVEHVFQNQGGLAQQHFNVGEMKQMPLPIPHVEEQDRIIARAASAERTSADLEATLTKLRRLKTGLMHDLLTGERSVAPLLTTSPS